MSKKKVWKILIPIISIILFFGLLCLFVIGVNEHYKGTKSPLNWCIWEISTHEDYDYGFTYIYQEIQPKSEIQKEADKGTQLYAYYITCFCEDRIGEWFCFIECFYRDLFDEMLNAKFFAASEVYLIDCDLIREELL